MQWTVSVIRPNDVDFRFDTEQAPIVCFVSLQSTLDMSACSESKHLKQQSDCAGFFSN